jgi:hypothetical protein
MLKKPGKKLNSATSSRSATARVCEPTAKSMTAFRLRADVK